jgi:hypothetical protein
MIVAKFARLIALPRISWAAAVARDQALAPVSESPSGTTPYARSIGLELAKLPE